MNILFYAHLYAHLEEVNPVIKNISIGEPSKRKRGNPLKPGIIGITTRQAIKQYENRAARRKYLF
jgi:hypothetical protein